MKCVSCGFEVPAEAKFAISKNQCPACGSDILDEETLALIDDVEKTIGAEVILRDGTARKLAVALISKYNIGFTGVATVSAPKQKTAEEKMIEEGDAPLKKRAAVREEEPAGVIKAELLANDAERDKFLAEAAERMYGVKMTDGIVGVEKEDVDIEETPLQTEDKTAMGGLFEEANPVLEKIMASRKKPKLGAGGFTRKS